MRKKLAILLTIFPVDYCVNGFVSYREANSNLGNRWVRLRIPRFSSAIQPEVPFARARPSTQSRGIGTPPLPEQIELHRDRMWRRDEDLRIESAVDAERFIEDVGFANTLTDARRAGPSLYIAVCGRRDVSLVDEGYAIRIKRGIYALASSKNA